MGWHNFHNVETLEETGQKTPAFLTNNAWVYDVLQQYWGKALVWTSAKKFLKTKDDRQVYRLTPISLA